MRWALWATALAAVFSFSACVAEDSGEDPWADSAAALDARRYVRPRLSTGPTFHECQAWRNLRCLDLTASDARALGAMARQYRQTWLEKPNDPSLLHRQSLWGLSVGLEDGRRATRQLERVVHENPSADGFSDLAAARLIVAAEEKRPESAIAALDAAEKSLRLQPDFSPGLYNRALALEALEARYLSKSAWRGFLGAERQPEWRLSGWQLWQRGQGQQEQESLRPDLLERDRFLRAACRELPALKMEAARWQAASGDRFFADTLIWAESAGCDGWNDAAEQVIEALDAYDARAQDADSRLAACRQHLAASGNPLEWLVAVYETVARRRSIGRDKDSLGKLLEETARLVIELEVRSYVGLEAIAHWSSATLAFRMGDLAGSNRGYAEALEGLERTRDSRAPEVAAYVAEGAFEAGRPDSAWPEVRRALRLVSLGNVEPSRRHATLQQIALLTLSGGYPHAGLFFQDAALAAAQASGESFRIAEAWVLWARLLARTQQPKAALRALERAQQAALAIDDEASREGVLASVALIFGDLGHHVAPARVCSEITRALNRFERVTHASYAALARIIRARCRADLGDRDGSEQDLQAVIDFLEGYGTNFTRPDEHAAIFDKFGIYDRLIDLLADQPGRESEALLVAERQRMTELRLLDTPFSETDKTLATVTGSLAPQEAVLFIRPTGSRVLLWSLDRHGVTKLADLDLAALQWALDTLRVPPNKTRDEYWHAASAALHEALLVPLEHRLGRPLDDLETLVLVAHGVFSNLALGALWDDQRQVYAGEKVAIRRVPSLLFATDQQGPGEEGDLDFLIVGDPVLAPGHSLPPLPGARAEAQHVGRQLAGQGVMLMGEAATDEAFLKHLPKARLVHFAGHVRTDARDPWQASLFLSPGEKSSDGRVAAREIWRQNLKAQIVVLSACDSGVRAGHGAGLEVAFLSRGVPHVITALSKLDDGFAPQFFAVFYQRITGKIMPETAFHDAQKASISAGLGPAAFYLAATGTAISRGEPE